MLVLRLILFNPSLLKSVIKITRPNKQLLRPSNSPAIAAPWSAPKLMLRHRSIVCGVIHPVSWRHNVTSWPWRGGGVTKTTATMRFVPRQRRCCSLRARPSIIIQEHFQILSLSAGFPNPLVKVSEY